MLDNFRHFFRTVIAAAKLDVVALDPVTSELPFSNAVSTLAKHKGKRFRRFFPQLFGLAEFSVSSIIRIRKLKRLPSAAPNAVVFVAATHNQVLAMGRVIEEFQSGAEVLDEEACKSIRLLGNLISILFIPLFLFKYAIRRNYGCDHSHHYASNYLRNYGNYIVGRFWIRVSSINLIVFSNDHVGFYKTLNKAAQDEGVQTAYIQHACVASYFPSLNFNYSFLDGLDAATKYCNRPSLGKVFLTGIAKFTPSKTPRLPTNSIGICFNLLDSDTYIKKLLLGVKTLFPNRKVVARFHPSTPRPALIRFAKFAATNGLHLSDSTTESSFEFSRSVAVIICGASSIILEASMEGVPCIAYFSDQASDTYGFVKNGLCPQASEVSQLKELIPQQLAFNAEKLAEKVRYYCIGFNIPNYPAPATLVADILKQACEGDVNLGQWSVLEGFSADVFQFKMPSNN
jgi:hypothetical protein